MLGEKYVALSAPAGTAPAGRLADGDRIPLSRSGRNPEIEEVLSALSALLNGGGVAQLKTITTELNKALEGRENRVKSLLDGAGHLHRRSRQQRKEIVRALEGHRPARRAARARRRRPIATGGRHHAARPEGAGRPAPQSDTDAHLAVEARHGRAPRWSMPRGTTWSPTCKHLRPILEQLNKAGRRSAQRPGAADDVSVPAQCRRTPSRATTSISRSPPISISRASTATSADEPGKPGSPGKPDLPGIPEIPGVRPLICRTCPTSRTRGIRAHRASLFRAPGRRRLLRRLGRRSALPAGVHQQLRLVHRQRQRQSGGGSPRFRAGVDLALAELMLKGMQP